jgi:hypothetical protein
MACASRGGSERSPAQPSHDANVIIEEEIRAASGSTLYDVIRSLRPAWLLARPTIVRSEGELVVYVDGIRFGNAASLRQLSPNTVWSVRYYRTTEAQARFGPGHLQGAIEVTTTSRP